MFDRPSTTVWLRIPFLFAIGTSFHRMLTPPNPPAAAHERVEAGALEGWFSKRARSGPFAVKTFMWLEITSEVAFALASQPGVLPPSWRHGLLRLLGGGSSFSGSYASVTPAFVLGTLVVVLGAELRIAAKRALGKHFTYELSVQREHKLITTFPYSLVRHPSYTGGFIAALGADMALFFARGGWVREAAWPWMTQRGGVLGGLLAACFVLGAPAIQVTMFGALMARTPVEDRMMRDEFGAQWDAWARRVSYRLIPWVY